MKDILEREVVSVYDHRHLNLEVPEFKTAIPTTENIAIAIWQRLDGKIPNAKLHRVRVYEMPDLFADYYGEPMKAHICNLSRATTSAPRIACTPTRSRRSENRAAFGKCNNPHGHGHNYIVAVTFSGQVDPATGMVCDLADLDAFAQTNLLDRFDHMNLNTLDCFRNAVPPQKI